MVTFQKVKIGDVCDLQQGLCINCKSKHLIVDFSDLPLLRITDLINNKQEQYIDSNLVSPQFISDEKSLIYTRTGQVGLVFKNRKGVVYNNCFKIIPKHGLDKDFLFYLLKQKGLHDNVVKIASKAAQPDLTHSAFKSIEISIPSNLSTQTCIASVLSAYDDLIENNEKRIKVLEEMAQLLYIEWFVKFKFPCYEKVKMVNSGTEYGMVPEGWEVETVGDFSELVSRGSSLHYIEEGGIPVVNQRCVRNDLIRWEAVQYACPLSDRNKNMYLRRYDCLINSMGVGTLGRVSRNVNIHEKAIIHNCITLVRTKNPNIESAFVYYFIKSMEKYLTSSGVGATGQTSLKPEVVANLKILVPQSSLLEIFSNKVMSMWDEVGMLLQNNEILQKTRDLLIPQLVTGKRELKK